MSGLTELLLWADHAKSHLYLMSQNLLSLTKSSNEIPMYFNLASGILLAYLLLIAIKPTPAKKKIAYAAFISLAINYSPLYDALNNVQFYSLYSLVYLTAAKYVTNKKIKSTLVIMSLFEFLMAYDRYVNPGIATWLYDSFEEVTCLIHALIISSSLKLKPINCRDAMGRFIVAMRGLSHSYCLVSRL